VIPLAAASLAFAACDSPESGRQRGERGADVGNRGDRIDMHGRRDVFYETPRKGPAR
jgi:hypothetical protein